jgi:hypothetical protein
MIVRKEQGALPAVVTAMPSGAVVIGTCLRYFDALVYAVAGVLWDRQTWV